MKKYLVKIANNDLAKFTNHYKPESISNKYDPSDFTYDNYNKRVSRSPNSVAPYTHYTKNELYNIYEVSVNDDLEIDEYYEPNLILSHEKSWTPLQAQYLTTTINYNTYENVHITSYNSTYTKAVSNETEAVGPWYLSSGYLNMFNAWDISRGNGVIVTCQERFDYTNLNWFITPSGAMTSGWHTRNYYNEWVLITSNNHPVFKSYYDETGTHISISGQLNQCFWYTGGRSYGTSNAYGCIDAYNLGTATVLPITSGNYYSPRSCYTANFNPTAGNCRNGEYRTSWGSTNIPSSFTPFDHGDAISSIVGSRISPTLAITSSINAIGMVGIAPECSILIGNNGPTYNARESVLGTDVRVGAFSGAWTQNESDIARTYGTMLVRGVGTNFNLNVEDTLGLISPYNSIAVGNCRNLGNHLTILESSSDLTNSGNYGTYGGYGRSNSIEFSAPSNAIWANGIRYNIDDYGIWSNSVNGDSVSASIGGGILALMASLRTGWSWEDIITAINQTCRQFDFRTVPVYNIPYKHLSQSIKTSGYSISIAPAVQSTSQLRVSGNTATSQTTNWFYAYPTGNKIDVYNKPYSVIQIGDYGSDNYELIYYFGKTIGELNITGLVDFGGRPNYGYGSFDNCIRGWGGTIPKIITGNIMIYTPLMNTASGWNEYLGWGIPNVAGALSIKQNQLDIMPPKRFSITYNVTGAEFTFVPFRSSNYGGVKVIKNIDHFPRNYSDGILVYDTMDSGSTIITGNDYSLTSGTIYYSAFQYTNDNVPKYSKVAPFSSDSITSTSFNYMVDKKNVELSIIIPQKHQPSYMRISGYEVLYTTGSSFSSAYSILSRNNTIKINSNLTSGQNVNIRVKEYGFTNNILNNSDFSNFTYSGFDNWTITGDRPTYLDVVSSITPSVEYNFGNYSSSFTVTGTSSNWFGLYYNDQVAVTNSNYYNLSAYIKTDSGEFTTYLSILCYSGSSYLGRRDIVSSGIDSSISGWIRLSGSIYPVASGLNNSFISGTNYIKPVIIGVSGTLYTGYNRLYCSNIQLESGNLTTNYSKFTINNKLIEYSDTYINPIGLPSSPYNVEIRRYRGISQVFLSHNNENDRRYTEVYSNGKVIGIVQDSGGVINLPYTESGTISLRSVDRYGNRSLITTSYKNNILYPLNFDFSEESNLDHNLTPINIPNFSTTNSRFIYNDKDTVIPSGIWLRHIDQCSYLGNEYSTIPYEFVTIKIVRDTNEINRFVNIYIKDENTGIIRQAKCTSKSNIILKRRIGESPIVHAVSAFSYEPYYSNVLRLDSIL